MALREQVAEVKKQSAAVEVLLEGLAQRTTESRARRDRLTSELDTLGGQLSEYTARKQALESSVAAAREGKRLTVAERNALEQEMEGLRSGQLESERRVDSAKNELSLRRNRLRALEDLHRRLEGVGAGTRALLSRADDAVLGMVVDRVEAPEELTLAFAGLLGERLQYVVVSDLDRGVTLLDELRRDERGRANIVAARPPHVAGARLLPGEMSAVGERDVGVLGRLMDRLE
jgi:chromosome segregation protein